MSRPTKKPGGRVGGSTKRSSLLLKRVPFKSFTVHHNPPVPTIYPGWIHEQFWIVQVVSGWDIWGGKGAGLQANHITTGRHQQVYCLVSGLCFGWGWCWLMLMMMMMMVMWSTRVQLYPSWKGQGLVENNFPSWGGRAGPAIYFEVNMYIYNTVTTFKYVEGGPDREALEVAWNTSSYI